MYIRSPFAHDPDSWIPRSPAVSGIAIFRILAAPFVNLGPAWFRRAIVDMIPVKQVQRLKNVVDVMHKRSVEIVTEKKAALQRGDEVLTQQVGEGKDVMSILRTFSFTATMRISILTHDVDSQSEYDRVRKRETH